MFTTKRKQLSFWMKSSLGMILAVFGIGSANAATYLSPVVGTAFTDLTTDVQTLFDSYIWPLLILIVATFFIMGLVKRGAATAK